MTIKHTAGGTRYEQHGEAREGQTSEEWANSGRVLLDFFTEMRREALEHAKKAPRRTY